MNFTDYKSSGIYWDMYLNEKTRKWFHSLGNELALIKTDWADQDIAEGFGNYYCELAYLQANIPKPWIDSTNKKYFSVFPHETYLQTEIGFHAESGYEIKLTKENYKNIYESIGTLIDGHPFNVIYLDSRVETLNQQLKQQGTSIEEQSYKFGVQKAINADKVWRGKEIEGFPIGKNEYTHNYYGLKPYAFEGFTLLNEYNIQELCKILADKYLENFTFCLALSNNKEFAYTRPVNEEYQWISLFTLRCPNILLYGLVPHLLLCKYTAKKTIKPKDVVFQGDFYGMNGNDKFIISKQRALYSQYFYYINRSVQRYINWIEPKLLPVVLEF